MRSLFLTFCVSCCALAGPIKGPAEITVGVGRLEAVPLEVDGDEITYVILGGDYFGGFREFSDPKIFRFQVLGYANGTGWIVIGTQKGGKLQPLHTVKVTVGNGPKPPPDPDPAPDDVDLVLAASIKRAAANDLWEFSKLAKCAKGFAEAAKNAKAGTVKQAKDALKTYMGTALDMQSVSPSVIEIFTTQIEAALGKQGDAPADPVAVAKVYTKLSKACARAAQ